MNKLIVRIDRDLIDLIPDFLTHKRSDAQAITAAAARGDYEALARFAHQIKGEGGSYGFDGLTEIGAALELAAGGKDLAEVRRRAADLSAYLDSIEIIYC